MDHLNTLLNSYGFRLPDLARIWQQHDVTDVKKEDESFVQQCEAFLVRAQEIALWVNPVHSVLAIGIVHFVFTYLFFTSSNCVNLGAWFSLLLFVWTTWVQRIFPEIRVEEPDEAQPWTPMHPEVYSAPEVERLVQSLTMRATDIYQHLSRMRSHQPAHFCLTMCFWLSLLAYVGAFVSLLGFFYYLTIISLTVPGVIKFLYHRNEAVREFVDRFKGQEHADQADAPTPTVASQTMDLFRDRFYKVFESPKLLDDSMEVNEYVPAENTDTMDVLDGAPTKDPLEAEELLQDSLTEELVSGLSNLPSADDLELAPHAEDIEDEFLPTVEEDQSTLQIAHQIDEDEEEQRTNADSKSQTSDESLSIKSRHFENSSDSDDVNHAFESRLAREHDGSEDEDEDFELISESELRQTDQGKQ